MHEAVQRPIQEYSDSSGKSKLSDLTSPYYLTGMATMKESDHSVTSQHDDAPPLGFAAQLDRPNQGRSLPASESTASGRPFCTYFQHVGHTQDRCFIGMGITPPPKGQSRGKGRGQSDTSLPSALSQGTFSPTAAATVAAPDTSVARQQRGVPAHPSPVSPLTRFSGFWHFLVLHPPPPNLMRA